MPGNLSPLELLVGAGVFGLVFALWSAGVLTWNVRRTLRAERVDARLGLLEPEEKAGERRALRLWHEGREEQTEVPAGPGRLSLARRLDSLRRDAGLEVPLGFLLAALGGGAGLLTLAFFLATGSLLPGLSMSGCGLALFWAWINWRSARRFATFERLFVDAMDLAARSLRAGHPLLGSFTLIHEEIGSPVGDVFGDICQQQALGLPIEEALRRAAADSPSSDLKLFATSVGIQMRSGGNLADMMERIAYVIRDRMRLSRRVRSLTAQTQFSKRILTALPVAMFLLLNAISPGYMTAFYETTDGQILLGAAGASVLLGLWTMARLVILRY
jgi:tight adherence protein B